MEAVDVLGHFLCAVYRAVLAAGAAERNHQVCESALFVSGYRGIYKGIAVVEEGKNLAVVLKKFYYRSVKACERLVSLVFAGIVHSAAVEHVSATVARCVVGYALL